MKKLTNNEFIIKSNKKHNYEYDYSLVDYKNNRIKILIICRKHGEFYQIPNSHLNGSGCPECGIIKSSLNSINNNWLSDFESVHGNRYDYSKVDYKGVRTKILIICKKHGEFRQTSGNHLSGQGCPSCNGNKKLTNLEFIKKSNNIHNDKYDYSMVKYNNSTTRVNIICKEHGLFTQNPSNHLRGQGCPYCVGCGKMNNIEFIKKSNNIHNNKYDYSITNFIKNKSKIDILCKEHGIFTQMPGIHLKGSGCPLCAGCKRLDNLEFIKKSNIIHNNKYDYSLVEYINAHTKVNIICKEHGLFSQKPYKHYNGRGCTKCGKIYGIKENKWLDMLGVVDRQVKIDGYIVDGYDSKTNTIYEFNGDFWHGNPNIYNLTDTNSVIGKSFGYLYNKTIKREQYFIDNGYKLITIWESEFLLNNF